MKPKGRSTRKGSRLPYKGMVGKYYWTSFRSPRGKVFQLEQISTASGARTTISPSMTREEARSWMHGYNTAFRGLRRKPKHPIPPIPSS